MLIILLLLALYIYNPDIERRIFVNELFSLFGFFLFFFKFTKGIKKNNNLEILVLILIIYSGFHLIISIPFRENNYIYFRQTCIIYSMFSFFLGSYLYQWKFRFINIFKYSALVLFFTNTFSFVYNIPGSGLFMGMRTTIGIFFGAVISRRKIIHKIVFIFFSLWSIIVFGLSSTITMCFFTITLFLFLRSYKLLFTVLIILSISIVIGLNIVNPYLAEIYRTEEGFWLSGQISSYGQVGEQFTTIESQTNLDNMLPRIILWHQAIIENYPRNLFGLGFGTSIFPFPEHLPFFPRYATSDFDINTHIHMMGAHNSFITLYARLGVLFLFIIGIIYYKVLKFADKFYDYLVESKDIIFFIIFFMISSIAFFNVVLESPIHASLYWISLGLCSQSINRITFIHESGES